MNEKEVDKKVEESFRKWFDEKFGPSGVSSSQLQMYKDCFKRGYMAGVIMLNEKFQRIKK